MRKVNLITRQLLITEISAFGWYYSRNKFYAMHKRVALHSCTIIKTHFPCR